MSVSGALSWALSWARTLPRINDARRATGGGPIRGWKVALHLVAVSDELAFKLMRVCPPSTVEAVFTEVRRRTELNGPHDLFWPVRRLAALQWVYDDLISGELDPRDLPIE